MRRNWLLPAGLATATALGALTLPALAHEFERGEGYGRMGERGEHGRGEAHGIMEMMREMYGSMGPGMMGGPGMMMGGPGMMGGMGPGGGMGPMGNLLQAFDADQDGTVTPDELRAGLEARLSEYDADGSGTLSIDEFEALHSAMIREMMVDRFQHLDNDGDGDVTAEEMTAPADRMQRMQEMRARMLEQRPGAAGPGAPQGTMPMQDMDPEDGMMDDMMDGDAMMDEMMPQDETAEPGGN